MSPPAGVRLAALLLAAGLRAGPAAAQDFAAPGTGDAPGRSPCALLERGLPASGTGVGLEAARVSWHALPDLATHALALGAGWRAARAAVGISRTGSGEIGWGAAGAALGIATRRAGAAARAVARRDLEPRERLTRLGAGVGLEAGAGAWAEASPGVRLWVSAPQVWAAGASPPLVRPLEIGAGFEGGGLRAWLARGAPRASDPGGGESAGGLALLLGPVEAWVEARDRPLRGALGLAARARFAAVAASVESHPVLGETARLAVLLGRAAP